MHCTTASSDTLQTGGRGGRNSSRLGIRSYVYLHVEFKVVRIKVQQGGCGFGQAVRGRGQLGAVQNTVSFL